MAISKVVYKSSANATPVTWMDATPATAAAADIISPKTAMLADGVVTQGTGSGGGTGAVVDVVEQLPGGGDHHIITGVDISDTTATASDVLNSKWFYTAAGVKTQGTASGGGGLVYEEGTWTPTEDVADPTINFADAHSTLPVFLMMSDATGTTDQTGSTNYGFLYGSFKAFTGEGVPSDATENRRYGLAGYVYRTSGNPAQGINGITALTGSSSYAQEYWVTTTGFIPSSASTTRYWRTGRTYKWIAVWAPTA